jgi:hypothetical protein
MSIRIAASAAALALALSTPAFAAGQDYRFESAASPQKAAGGKSVVAVRIVHVPDGKPVPGAVVIQTKADMGPSGMGEMSAPVKPLGESGPGVYRFEVQPGMPGKWALTLAAKVQGEPDTVRGTLTVDLAP